MNLETSFVQIHGFTKCKNLFILYLTNLWSYINTIQKNKDSIDLNS